MGRLPRRGPCPGRWLTGRLSRAVGLGLTTIRTPRTLPRAPRSVSWSESREGRASLRLQEPRKEAGCGPGGGS